MDFRFDYRCFEFGLQGLKDLDFESRVLSLIFASLTFEVLGFSSDSAVYTHVDFVDKLYNR